jgi:hypothetical protein
VAFMEKGEVFFQNIRLQIGGYRSRNGRRRYRPLVFSFLPVRDFSAVGSRYSTHLEIVNIHAKFPRMAFLIKLHPGLYCLSGIQHGYSPILPLYSMLQGMNRRILLQYCLPCGAVCTGIHPLNPCWSSLAFSMLCSLSASIHALLSMTLSSGSPDR